ncbi:aspartate/glutamate racemase family protein [Staphylococcus sp. SQ8-PEA]|uniref:Aspartate/glutamate racemase family protein n=1 Tax=Staphylococcus marylandisciuri TaxID=2981529 RepID=A0ABT2QN85_9STAP|nr:aspartate/glutamate racemase family protein [Staphylococcus marylandisciuri]MCU5745435.1 aspartate/glutamate racemase family protein [Staphylococcus marylandisciuri]
MKANKQDFANSIAVFDAGIGSYAVVELIKAYYPKQNIIYFADRAHFPYGNKTKGELRHIITRTIDYLMQYQPKAIIVASNAPSVMVLDEVKAQYEIPIYGIKPPVKQAIESSKTKHVAVLGAKSLVESERIHHYIEEEKEGTEALVSAINASDIIQLVESGAFINHPAEVKEQLKDFIRQIRERDPEVDTFTLSSTHLPWIQPYLTILYPQFKFLDPAKHIIEALNDVMTKGKGQVKALVSTCDDYTLENFEDTLNKLNIKMDIEEVDIKCD